MGQINWLASYPKSGNTWMRIFLINLLNPHLTAAVNQLHHIPHAASRSLFDEYSGINSSDLTDQEIELMRPEVYQLLAKQSKRDLFLKIHDAYKKDLTNTPLISKKGSKAIVYLIRNPLDIAVSFAKFKGTTLEQIILEMADSKNYLAKQTHAALKMQLPQLLSSWSEHVLSWTQQRDVPILIIRYEDLIANPFSNFKKTVEFLNLQHSDTEVKNALDRSNFNNLKKQEMKFGFQDKFPTTKHFFRKGIAGEGMQLLSNSQINKITKKHGEVMSTFNYLPS
jgi:hypothetical protein